MCRADAAEDECADPSVCGAAAADHECADPSVCGAGAAEVSINGRTVSCQIGFGTGHRGHRFPVSHGISYHMSENRIIFSHDWVSSSK